MFWKFPRDQTDVVGFVGYLPETLLKNTMLIVAVEWLFCPVKHPQVIRLVSLQRGVLKVEQKMMGIQCSTYSEPWILSLKWLIGNMTQKVSFLFGFFCHKVPDFGGG